MIKFLDRPCGHGKTEELLASFELEKHYFVVVNTRDEIKRFLNQACVPFTTPEPQLILQGAVEGWYATHRICPCIGEALAL